MASDNANTAANLDSSNIMGGIHPSRVIPAPTTVDATVKVEAALSMDATAPSESVKYLMAKDPRHPPQPASGNYPIADSCKSMAIMAVTDSVLTSDMKSIKEEAQDVPVKVEPSDMVDARALPKDVEASESTSDTPPPEFRLAFESLEDSTLIGLVNTQGLPRTPNEFNKFRFDPEYQTYTHARVIAVYVARLGRNSGNGELPSGGYQVIHNMIKALFKIEDLTTESDREYKYTWILKTIMGESELATKPYAFPPILVEQASIVLGHLQDDLNIEVAIDASPTPPAPPTPVNKGFAEKKLANEKSATKKRKAKDISTDNPIQRKFLDMNNPSIAATMYNIHLEIGSRRGYKITNPTLKSDYNKFGHNGLKVGDWWPYQLCALRDGAHGSAMGGIAGSASHGAKSIMVGGGYEGMDKDEGNVIYYSGSNSHENKDATTPHISNGTKSLQRSMLDNRTIRVLRSAKGDARFAPSVGIRYDGLYKIVAEEQRFNAKGGAYLRFKLVRQEGQPDIDLSRPDQKDKNVFTILKQSV